MTAVDNYGCANYSSVLERKPNHRYITRTCIHHLVDCLIRYVHARIVLVLPPVLLNFISVMACLPRIATEEVLCQAFSGLSTTFSSLKPRQAEAALAVLQGKDIFVRLPTGYGKTAIMAVLPKAFDILRGLQEPRSIVICVCPLIALMQDLKRRLLSMGLTAEFLGSAQEDLIAAVTAGKIQCVLATPETLLNNSLVREMLLSQPYQENLTTIVVDEAHCISKWYE